MEEMFLNIIRAISDSRFWLLPILLFCLIIMIIKMFKELNKDY